MKKVFTFAIIGFAFVSLLLSCKSQKENSRDKNENQETKTSIDLLSPGGPVLLMKTSKGDIKLRLFNETPKHRDNFVKLANEKYYEGTLFHRVIQEFMIQGGDPDSKNAKPGAMLGEGGPGYEIDPEFVDGIIHKRGALATAREGNNVNPKKKSAGSQFYIVQGKTYTEEELAKIEKKLKIIIPPKAKEVYKTIGGTPFLDQDYTVFGEVIEGLEVIDSIAAVEKDGNDRPLVDVVIKSLTVIEK